MSLRFGFPCIPLGLSQPFVRTCKLANATPERLAALIDENLRNLEQVPDYAAEMGFKLFRIHSDTIPFGSHPDNKTDWIKKYRIRLAKIGRMFKKKGIRLSMHPGQFTLLSSPNENTTRNAVLDLKYHSRLLAALGCGLEGKVVIHLGGVYGDKEAAIARFKRRWRSLAPKIRSRVVIENDEFSYSIYDVLDVGKELGIPVVFDRFHHRIHGDERGTPIEELLRTTAKTWRPRDGRMKVHFSSQAPGKRPGTHGERIIASEFQAFLREARGIELDVMVESKGKERTAKKALDAFNNSCP